MTVRYGEQDDGKRYVARENPNGTNRFNRCQHALWRCGRVEWRTHSEGGYMEPFEGPDDVYAAITKGGRNLWGAS